MCVPNKYDAAGEQKEAGGETDKPQRETLHYGALSSISLEAMIDGASSGFLNLAGIQCVGDVWQLFSATLWPFSAGPAICDAALKMALISRTVAVLRMRIDSGMVNMFQEKIVTFGGEVHRIQIFTSTVHNIKCLVLVAPLVQGPCSGDLPA